MGPPQPARGTINIEACARPIVVDHRIRLPYYFRIAGSLLRQANIYRNEKNLLDLYVILLRYSSLLCETIPKHRDYNAFKLKEKEFFTKLVEVLNELESLKPVVQRQIAEYNRGSTVVTNNLNGIYATTLKVEQHTPSLYATQAHAGSTNGSSQNFFRVGRHQVSPLPNVQPDRQFRKQLMNLPYPKEETLARHSILGPNGLHGQWNGPVTGIKVQYPSNAELTQSVSTSLVPAISNQDDLSGVSASTTPPDSSTNDNDDMKAVLSLDDGRWSVQTEERIPFHSVTLEEELSQLNVKQPSPPPVLAEIQRPISPSRVADPTPEIPSSEIGRFQNLHVPVKLMECFLRVAEANTRRSLETCGVLAGTLCEATNEEELFEVQDMGSLFTLGWIHVMLPEAIAIVMAPTDTTRKHAAAAINPPPQSQMITLVAPVPELESKAASTFIISLPSRGFFQPSLSLAVFLDALM
ncbi:hypothetical protein PR202_ga22943 [Eleusine coracana subsp. coracana]|uniref:USP8 dimerisation domain-containing protein n=1 Tax=Eleusine coracana subsp. coracana TaxID=191504 RepID=A0AAV5D307_ELECO|nr:hypothetical protein PR202_ga22943 [Eleusine coracana subsp. coracana]